jgi:hypothetical protein
VSFSSAHEKLEHELRLLGARHIVISFNRNDRDGAYNSNYDRRDAGIAVYFILKGRQLVVACDRYLSPADNLRSIGLAVAAMRQLARHGGGAMMDRAFTGFVALPAPKSCWEILGVPQGAGQDVINRAYRTRAKEAHPDNGGSNTAMAELNAARDEALGVARAT